MKIIDLPNGGAIAAETITSIIPSNEPPNISIRHGAMTEIVKCSSPEEAKSMAKKLIEEWKSATSQSRHSDRDKRKMRS